MDNTSIKGDVLKNRSVVKKNIYHLEMRGMGTYRHRNRRFHVQSRVKIVILIIKHRLHNLLSTHGEIREPLIHQNCRQEMWHAHKVTRLINTIKNMVAQESFDRRIIRHHGHWRLHEIIEGIVAWSQDGDIRSIGEGCNNVRLGFENASKFLKRLDTSQERIQALGQRGGREEKEQRDGDPERRHDDDDEEQLNV